MSKDDAILYSRFFRVNELYFQNSIPFNGLSWSTGPFSISFRHGGRLKKCLAICTDDGQIFINVCLKRRCPNYVLEYLIYHECLHLSWRTHCKSFRREERKFKHYRRAEDWLARHEGLIKAGRH